MPVKDIHQPYNGCRSVHFFRARHGCNGFVLAADRQPLLYVCLAKTNLQMKAISSRRPASGLIAELWLEAAPAISRFFITLAAFAAALTIIGAGLDNDRLLLGAACAALAAVAISSKAHQARKGGEV